MKQRGSSLFVESLVKKRVQTGREAEQRHERSPNKRTTSALIAGRSTNKKGENL